MKVKYIGELFVAFFDRNGCELHIGFHCHWLSDTIVYFDACALSLYIVIHQIMTSP